MRKPLFALTLAILCLSLFSSAQTYTFTGATNDWILTSNWLNGSRPPESLPVGHTINVQAVAVNAPGCITPPNPVTSCPTGTLFESKGALVIHNGSSLTLRNATQFMHKGQLTINAGGTLINQTTFEGYSNGTITVNGTLRIDGLTFGNQGSITVGNGGVINVAGGYLNNNMFNNGSIGQITVNTGGSITVAPTGRFNPGTIIFQPGSSISNAGLISNTASIATNFTNSGTVTGNLTVTGDLTNSGLVGGNATINGNMSNSGTVAPGNSPGSHTITGTYTATSSAIHNFEVAGTSASQYDRMNVSGAVTLGGTLNVSLINGFTPTGNHDLPIITGPSISGSFSSVNIPAASGYTLVYTPTSVILRRSSVLPVNFTGLQIQRAGSSLNLIWKVAGEQGVSRYEVEGSGDGRSYQILGAKPASGQAQYFLHVPVPLAKTFYRIRAVDADGKVKYSPIATFAHGRAIIALNAYPSATTGVLQVQYEAAGKGACLRILSSSGQVVLVQALPEGSQQVSLDVSLLPTGVYTVHYAGKERVQTVRFRKE